MTSMTVMRLFDADLPAIESHLQAQVEQAPAFFQGAPLVIDLTNIEGPGLDLAGVVRLAREQGLVPVAVTGGEAQAAAGLGLGVLDWKEPMPEQTPEPPPRAAEPSAEPAPPTAPAQPSRKPTAASPSMVVTQLVRSGQQIYARGGDLLVLNQVSPGAEVIADGHIHIYGALRGRALAGAQGDENTRVFCKRMEAELIAVAGVYRVSEQLDEQMRGQAAQAYLRDGNLVLEAI